MAKNPFPGMNPYLERHWGDVHASLILYARDQINRQLGGSLRARVEERLVVENLETEQQRAIKPDVRIYDRPSITEASTGTALLPATEVEPDLITLAESEPETTTYLKIIDSSTGGTLITVVEFLSPANKEPEKIKSSDQYQAKRAELKLGGVGLVEIDLLREGERFFPEYHDRYGKCLRSTYAACIRRGWRSSNYEVYCMQLRERLPSIRIPLRKQDGDVRLDLQSLVDLVYENGRYDDIDYERPLNPPLSKEDAEWVKGLLAPPAPR